MNTTPPVVSEVALVAVDADTATATSPFRAAGVKRPRVEDAQLLGVDIDSRDVVILEVFVLEDEEEAPEWVQAAVVKLPRVEDAQLLRGPEIDSRDVVILEIFVLEDEEEESARRTLNVAGAPAGYPEYVVSLFGLVQEIRQQVDRVEEQMAAGFSNLDARMFNGLADMDDALVPLAAPGGLPVPNFPLTRAGIAKLPGPQLATLLQAYGQEVPQGLRERRRAFARYVGVRIN